MVSKKAEFVSLRRDINSETKKGNSQIIKPKKIIFQIDLI